MTKYFIFLVSKASHTCKFLLAIGFLLLDPFGLVTASDNASANFINRMKSTLYSNEAQQEIIVVLIDEQYLKHTESSWPLPYNQQIRLFRKILHYQPKAMFIDLVYSQDRSEGRDKLSRLPRILERYEKLNGTKTFLALSDDGVTNIPQALSEQKYWADIAWKGYGDQYPLNTNGLNTAALALYEEYCKQTGKCEFQRDSFKAPMSIQWGDKVADFQNQLTPNEDCKRNTSIIRMFLSDLFWRISGEKIQECPYSQTMMASTLIGSDEDAERLFSAAFKDKIVLIGANISGAQDKVVSPVHGLTPGVFLHAMALDNLITYGDNYLRDSPSVLDTDINWIDLVELLFVLLIFKLRWAKQASAPADLNFVIHKDPDIANEDASCLSHCLIEGKSKPAFEKEYRLSDREMHILHEQYKPLILTAKFTPAESKPESKNVLMRRLSRWKRGYSKALIPYVEHSMLTIIGSLFLFTAYLAFFTEYRVINFIGLFFLAVSLIPNDTLEDFYHFLTIKITKGKEGVS